MKPTVSVCIQTYNHEAYIKECLDSILMQQTTFPFEIILGEDESSDGTRDICQAYSEEYPDKIKLFLRSRKDVIYINGNPTGRYNFIENLKACTGKYIALCEGDDYWTDPLKLQKQVDFMEANSEYSGCFHNTNVINEMEANPELKPWRTFTKHDFTLKDTLSVTSLFHTSSFVFKTNALKIPSWFKKVQSGDMALFIIIASQGPLYRIDENMSVYRRNETGITNSIKHIEYHANRIKLFEYFKAFLDGRENEQLKIVSDYHKGQLKKLKKTSLKSKLKQIFKM
ncbi:MULTISPECIES: glycosyltransferase family 2 protein [Aequorivita]|uniref:Glycosyltransferase n=1 Tax=Aequorivita iocasae TaxID=2803865 RepID=A0ABX7DRS5_9FLAO|nr:MULTISPECIES: glycosyltransferase [Aequorivita]QQX76799.1 glycosyltransferase [Aequorivita iocasae]UCA56271.1 glycosyltransferase [Aequorivita sp. F7]